MKEYLLSLLTNTPNPLQARNQAREYLQALILQSLQRAGAMVPLAFHGGTALRFLYNSQRYSEDLDFALEGNADAYDFHGISPGHPPRPGNPGVRGDSEGQRPEDGPERFRSFPGITL